MLKNYTKGGFSRETDVVFKTPSKQALCAFDPQVKAMWGTLLKVDKLFTGIFKSNLNCTRLQQKLEHRLHFAQMQAFRYMNINE